MTQQEVCDRIISLLGQLNIKDIDQEDLRLLAVAMQEKLIQIKGMRG